MSSQIKYHISPQDNVARLCSAQKRGCDYGIAEQQHLTEEAAQEHNAKVAQGTNPTVATLTKPKKAENSLSDSVKYQETVSNGKTSLNFTNKESLTPEFAETYAKSFIFDRYEEVHQSFINDGLPTDENSFVLNSDLESLRKSFPESFEKIDKNFVNEKQFTPADYLADLETSIREEEQENVIKYWSQQKPQVKITSEEIRKSLADGVYNDNPAKKYSLENE